MPETALVTGGAKRIGKEIAILLSVLGYNIALHYNQSKNEAEATAKEIESYGANCKIFKCNLGRTSEVLSLIGKVNKQFPNLNLLVNSASIFEKSSLLETSPAIFEKHFDLNFKAPFFLSCEFAKQCKKGHIINLLDTHITVNQTTHAVYLLSKKSLAEFTKLAAIEFAPHIRVNAIAPGLILPPDGKKNNYLKRLANRIPLKRKGHPNQIAQAVQFLIENDFITGQTIFVDGGEHLLGA